MNHVPLTASRASPSHPEGWGLLVSRPRPLGALNDASGISPWGSGLPRCRRSASSRLISNWDSLLDTNYKDLRDNSLRQVFWIFLSRISVKPHLQKAYFGAKSLVFFDDSSLKTFTIPRTILAKLLPKYLLKRGSSQILRFSLCFASNIRSAPLIQLPNFRNSWL